MNTSNPTTAFVSQQHIAEHSQQIIVPQHRIVTANCGQMQQVCHMPTAATSHAPILAQSYHHDSKQPPVRGKTSPYGFFVKMCYEEHKKKYPTENVQVTEISKKCSQKWKVSFHYFLLQSVVST